MKSRIVMRKKKMQNVRIVEQDYEHKKMGVGRIVDQKSEEKKMGV